MAINETSPATDEVGAGPLEGEDRHRANARMRYDWLEATLEIAEATGRGDMDAARAAGERRDRIREEFLAANYRLAMSAAQNFLVHARGEDLRDHEQAALLGLWEAFVGTDPAKSYRITRDDDGNPVAEAGWNPAKATFGTLSRSYITGKVRRSVALNESGLSYAMWTERQKVLRCRDELKSELGVEPTVEQVAARIGMTRDSVAAILTPSAVSLQTPIGEDGMTLGDTLGERAAVDDEGPVIDLTDMPVTLVRRAMEHVAPVDMFAFVLREGLAACAELNAVDVAQRLGIGRGTVASAVRRSRTEIAREMNRAAYDVALTGLAHRDPRFARLVAVHAGVPVTSPA